MNKTWRETPLLHSHTGSPSLPSCFLSADYPAFTGLWLSGARKRFNSLSRSRLTHLRTNPQSQTHTLTLCCQKASNKSRVFILLWGWLLKEFCFILLDHLWKGTNLWVIGYHIKALFESSQVRVRLLVPNLQASVTSSPGPSSLGSQVHAAAVNGDRSTLLKLITGINTRSLSSSHIVGGLQNWQHAARLKYSFHPPTFCKRFSWRYFCIQTAAERSWDQSPGGRSPSCGRARNTTFKGDCFAPA